MWGEKKKQYSPEVCSDVTFACETNTSYGEQPWLNGRTHAVQAEDLTFFFLITEQDHFQWLILG